MAGGKAIGLNGEIRGFNADVEARLAGILMDVGRWVERESGALMGHIKMAVSTEDQTLTMNLTDISEGVLYHGRVKPSRIVDFSFMAAVLDVDEGELEHVTLHAFDDSGINATIDGHSRSHHHHDHGEDCKCGCHGHHHEHHHDHGEECECGCHGHHHEHGEECHCHEHHHDHEHKHRHDHGDECKCGCHGHHHDHDE